jgi:tetratricopeptide (TPR) repeat protein
MLNRMDRGAYLEGLAAVCMTLRDFPALENALRRGYTLTELCALLRDERAGVRGAAALGMGAIGDYTVVQVLARRLHDESDPVRVVAEQSLWAIWLRSGDEAIDSQMRSGSRLMQRKNYDEAIQVFTEITQQRPTFPEGYNQRAIAYYLNGDYERSITDCEKVVELNPVHFGALAGMGHSYLHLNRKEQALNAYERALTINPNMDEIRMIVSQLRRE